MVRASSWSSRSQGTLACSYILGRDWQLPDKLLENFLEKKTHACSCNRSSQQYSCFSVPTPKWTPVNPQALACTCGLLISLCSTFVLNVSEQPKSMRHIRKAADATQRHQMKKIKEEPRRNTVPLDWTQEWITWIRRTPVKPQMNEKNKKQKKTTNLFLCVAGDFCGCLLHSKSWLIQSINQNRMLWQLNNQKTGERSRKLHIR